MYPRLNACVSLSQSLKVLGALGARLARCRTRAPRPTTLGWNARSTPGGLPCARQLALATGFAELFPIPFLLTSPIPSSSKSCPSPVQVWRLATHVIVMGKFSLSFLMRCVWILTYGAQLESVVYENNPEDYLFLFLFSATAFAALSLGGAITGALSLVLSGTSMVMVLIYLWSKEFPEKVRRCVSVRLVRVSFS